MTSTGTNLLGFDRPYPEALPRRDDESASGTDHWATQNESRPEIIDLYHRVWTHSDATIDAFALDAHGYVPWWREEVPLFNVMVHCLADTTRHAGHADILREGLDGAVGVEKGSAPRQGRDDAFWKTRRATIEEAARAADPD